MEIERISLEKLRGHPANANVMDKAGMAKLSRHIERSGYYEPLVVRRHPDEQGCYQLVNGHHRKLILQRLGYKEADCVVWDVDDDESLMLLASLNRLGGRDVPKLRGRLLEELSKHYGEDELLKSLPERRRQLQKLLAVNRPAEMLKPAELDDLPHALTFFVSSEQKAVIEKALREIRRRKESEGVTNLKRGDLLAIMAENLVMNNE
jgi:ParB-like chromosome segregation protein Spo0J